MMRGYVAKSFSKLWCHKQETDCTDGGAAADGGHLPCIDYGGLNKTTINRKVYRWPIISFLFLHVELKPNFSMNHGAMSTEYEL